MLPSSHENSVLNAIRRSGVGYAEALSVIVDSQIENPTKKQRISANSPRGKLLQRLFSLGPCRLVPDPHEDGWFYKGGGRRGVNGYADRLERYGAEAEIVLSRIVSLQKHLQDELLPDPTDQSKEG